MRYKSRRWQIGPGVVDHDSRHQFRKVVGQYAISYREKWYVDRFAPRSYYHVVFEIEDEALMLAEIVMPGFRKIISRKYTLAEYVKEKIGKNGSA